MSHADNLLKPHHNEYVEKEILLSTSQFSTTCHLLLMENLLIMKLSSGRLLDHIYEWQCDCGLNRTSVSPFIHYMQRANSS